MSRRAQLWVCLGNVLIALVLGAAELAIATRSLWLDVPGTLLIAALLASCVAVALREPKASVLLQIAALLLLVFGVFATTALALTTAFLFGVHGHFLRDGAELVTVGFGLVVPYTLAYPLLVLAHCKRAR